MMKLVKPLRLPRYEPFGRVLESRGLVDVCDALQAVVANRNHVGIPEVAVRQVFRDELLNASVDLLLLLERAGGAAFVKKCVQLFTAVSGDVVAAASGGRRVIGGDVRRGRS